MNRAEIVAGLKSEAPARQVTAAPVLCRRVRAVELGCPGLGQVVSRPTSDFSGGHRWGFASSRTGNCGHTIAGHLLRLVTTCARDCVGEEGEYSAGFDQKEMPLAVK